MTILRLIALLLIISIFSGCGTTKLTKEVRSELNSVVIDTDVTEPKEVYYTGPGEAFGIVFLGPILGGAVNDMDDTPTRLKKFLDHNKISIKDMVLREFTSQLNTDSFFKSKLKKSKSNDAHFKLEVSRYGLGVSGAFTENLRPTLSVVIKLIDRNGEIIWRGYDSINQLFDSESKEHTLEEYLANPEILKNQYLQLAKRTVTAIMQSLQES